MSCVPETTKMTLEWQLRFAINLFVATVPPTFLGLIGEPPLSFLLYAAGIGTALMLAEQPSLARDMLARADVRSYLQVRVALVLLCGVVPYFLGSMLGRIS